MPKIFQVQSLEEACFSYILQTLHEYPVAVLALLPVKYRKRMLFNLPVIDICRLEQPQFISDLDMEKVWEHVCKLFVKGYDYMFNSPPQNLKETLLETVCDTLLEDGRPYGYFQWTSRCGKRSPWIRKEIVEDHPVEKHPLDVVNCLVAIRKESNSKSLEESEDEESDEESYYKRKFGPCCVSMTRHEVTLHKGVVPPCDMYSKACQFTQTVPRRYAHLFTQDGHFLPDSTAISLITKECSYKPMSTSIDCCKFNTFLENFEHEGTNISLLVEFFKNIESLVINGEPDPNPDLIHDSYLNAKNIKPALAVPSKVLQMILLNPRPVLSSLTICVNKSDDTIIETIEPILTTSYSGLKSLALDAEGKVSPDLKKLIAITDYQANLQKVDISISEITQVFGCFIPAVKHTPEFSPALLFSWVELCCKKPTLQNLRLHVNSATVDLLQKIVATFLSTPCSCEQTLTLGTIDFVESEDAISPIPSVPEGPCTLCYKCLSIPCYSGKHLSPFEDWIFNSLQIKLRQLTVNEYSYGSASNVISRLAKGCLDFQMLVLQNVDFSYIKAEDYKDLFHKPSLKSLKLEKCSNVVYSEFACGLAAEEARKLVELSIGYYDYYSPEEPEDDSGLMQLFETVFSLPLLPEFSLSLIMTLTGEQMVKVLSIWEQTCKTQMKYLRVTVAESDITASLENDLSKIAATVQIDKRKSQD